MFALIEGVNTNIVCLVLLHDTLRFFVRIEGIHQNKRDVHVVLLIEILELGTDE